MTESTAMKLSCETPPTDVAAGMATTITQLIPRITTARLELRAPVVEDFQVYAGIVCTARGRYVGGPMSREDAWFDFSQMASNWLLHGHGGFSIRHLGGKQTIGFVVLGFEPGDREVELGYLLDQASERHGYALEASKAVRDWAFDYYGWRSLVSYIDQNNKRSIKLATRMGAQRDKQAKRELGAELADCTVYRHLAAGTTDEH